MKGLIYYNGWFELTIVRKRKQQCFILDLSFVTHLTMWMICPWAFADTQQKIKNCPSVFKDWLKFKQKLIWRDYWYKQQLKIPVSFDKKKILLITSIPLIHLRKHKNDWRKQQSNRTKWEQEFTIILTLKIRKKKKWNCGSLGEQRDTVMKALTPTNVLCVL